MSVQFPNVYHLRKVAGSSSKPCSFCFKPTVSVLITSDGVSDFFYTCDSHLKDPAFSSPVFDQEYLRVKKEKEALDQEIKHLKLKWDEKNRYATWDKFVSYTKFNSTPKEDKDENVSKDKTKEEEPEAKIKALDKQSADFDSILKKQHRIYRLNKDIYKIRLEKKVKTKKPNPNVTRSTITPKDLSNLPVVPKTPLP